MHSSVVDLAGNPLGSTETWSVSMVAATGDKGFTITFTPAASGTKTVTVTVTDDDADEGTYDFSLQSNTIDTLIEETNCGNYTSIAVDSSGTIYVAYRSWWSSDVSLKIASSSDGGVTWFSEMVDDSASTEGIRGEITLVDIDSRRSFPTIL